MNGLTSHKVGSHVIGTIRKETHYDPNEESKVVTGYSLWCYVVKRKFNVYQRAEELFPVWTCIWSTHSGNIGYELSPDNLNVVRMGWPIVREGVPDEQ
jgi:hypothetical protein